MSMPTARHPSLASLLHHTGSETDDGPGPGTLTRQPSQDVGDAASNVLPTLIQRLRHTSSILAITISESNVYAGTQGGEILVYELETFVRQAVIEGHRGSVLALCLSQDQSLLFSSAGDRIVNIWDTKSLSRVYCLFSSFDVGDLFCTAYSSALSTVYIGAQNTSIQWCNNIRKESKKTSSKGLPASYRNDDPFFDSRGPGGVRTPRPPGTDFTPRHAKGGETLEIDRNNVRQFAHYGYVYCMLLVKDGVPERSGQETLITGGGDGVVKLWKVDGENGGAIEEMYGLDDGREEGHAVLSIAMDGAFVYTGRSGGEVDVWDLETRQLVRNIKAHRDDVQAVCVGGGFMFTSAVTGYVRKFDRQYQLKNRLKAHTGRILASAFAYYKHRPLFVTGSNDNSLAIWDVTDCTVSTVAPSKTSDEQLLESLKRFISFRTVSTDPRYQVDCRRAASYLRSVFKNFGASTEMLPTEDPSNPVILARFRGNPATASKRKKILFYGHYDVVAANNETGKWLTDPFTMEGVDGYLYGRGTSDNKGPIMAAIYACAELTSEQALGSDIIFLIEGEEENGSHGFEKVVNASKDKIGEVDWILLANSYWLDDQIPCLTYGLRGVIHATVQVESAHPDLHSGVDGSSQLDESLKDLVMLLGTLTGVNGEIKIPGFYDPVLKVGKKEAELYHDITDALLQRNPDLGNSEELTASLMRRWREASLTIHHFHTSGPDNSTIIPRLAKAAISMRLVPNQEANEVGTALTRYLEAEFKKLGSNNRLTIKIVHQAEPWLGDWTNEIYQMLEEAILEAWGPIEQAQGRRSIHKRATSELQNGESAPKPPPATSTTLAHGRAPSMAEATTPANDLYQELETLALSSNSTKETRRKPLYIREGGSIPAIRFLEKVFNAPAAQLPCGQASDSAHLDNERLRLVNLYKAKDIFKKVFRDLPRK